MALFGKAGSAVVEVGELRLRDVPAIRQAGAMVLDKMRERDEAEQVANSFPRDEVSLAVLQARQAAKDAAAAVKIAEEARDELREVERVQISEARQPGRRALVAELNEALERAAEVNSRLVEHETTTEYLCEKSFVVRAQFIPVARETPNQDSFLSAWQRALKLEGLL